MSLEDDVEEALNRIFTFLSYPEPEHLWEVWFAGELKTTLLRSDIALIAEVAWMYKDLLR